MFYKIQENFEDSVWKCRGMLRKSISLLLPVIILKAFLDVAWVDLFFSISFLYPVETKPALYSESGESLK